MAPKTIAEQLEEVQNAISEIMTSQSSTIMGDTVTKADLAALTKREEHLLGRYYVETGDYATRTYVVDGDSAND